MRLEGFFRRGDSAPYITTTVIQKSLNIVGEIRFLIDTGASSTTISYWDAQRLGIDFSKLEHLSGGMAGVGGVAEAFILPQVELFFLMPGTTFQKEMEKVYILCPPQLHTNQNTGYIPSLLGRDFLNH